jgi:hypothetical protein
MDSKLLAAFQASPTLDNSDVRIGSKTALSSTETARQVHPSKQTIWRGQFPLHLQVRFP